jgi:hypothetical protein
LIDGEFGRYVSRLEDLNGVLEFECEDEDRPLDLLAPTIKWSTHTMGPSGGDRWDIAPSSTRFVRGFTYCVSWM